MSNAAQPMRKQQSLVALNQGLAFEEGGRPEEAFSCYVDATGLDPGNGRAWRQLGNLLRRAARLSDASECFERALEAGDDRALNEFFLSAVGIGSVTPIAPPAFVEALFDQYSSRFDNHLLRELGYQVPQLLRRLISNSETKSFHSMLDLGCGTGLSGEAFRTDVHRSTGVDLSERMLHHAKRRGAYDRLVQSELCQHLEVDDEKYDLVICCDAFIYVGDLARVFSGVRHVLSPQGSFGFSVETCEAELGYDLLPSLRFAHSRGHVCGLASRHGLDMEAVESCCIRLEAGVPVSGELFHFRAR